MDSSVIDSYRPGQLQSQEQEMAGWTTKTKVLVPFIVGLAFLVRCVIRFSYGEKYFWTNSYSLFYELSQSMAEGRGLCYEWVGVKCAQRPPVYPTFLLLT